MNQSMLAHSGLREVLRPSADPRAKVLHSVLLKPMSSVFSVPRSRLPEIKFKNSLMNKRYRGSSVMSSQVSLKGKKQQGLQFHTLDAALRDEDFVNYAGVQSH